LVLLAVSVAVLFNILHVAIIECGEVGPGLSVGAKEFVKLGVKRLGYRDARFC
jgi:hypothetical protein